MRRLFVALGIGLFGLGAAAAAQADPVIIKCTRPCAEAIRAVEANGGIVTYQYKYVDAIAAEVNGAALTALRRVVEPGGVRKDLIVDAPMGAPARDGASVLEVEALSADGLGAAEIVAMANADPNAYRINNPFMNLNPIHGSGILGQGMKVAVIDSGIRPGFPHIDLDGSVIGGENLVPDLLGFSHFSNAGHGTFVAGMISANVVFTLGGGLLSAVTLHCPSCIGPAPNHVGMIGSAPSSSIYAVKVFGATGGSPTSRVIAAMERVLTLRENYDNGMPETQNPDGSYDALNVTVCNMSLGGPTLYAGRDIENQLTKAFLDKDIVLVVAAGNAGPGGATVGSPGTGFASLTVGASSSPVHERILRSAQFGLAVGALYRPFNAIQMAYFSSRGPNADGRPDPDVVANGFASFGQGFGATTGTLSTGSGTSFASPSVAGVAALLRQAAPAATARQVRNAIMLSANPALVADGSGPLDRGAGHVDGDRALALLQTWTAPDTAGAEGGTNKNVNVNVLQGASVETYAGDVVRTATGLLPGQRFDTFYRVNPNTSAVVVTLSDVTPGSPQNPLFGDDILLAVHSAKTSAIGEGDYRVLTLTTGGTFTIPDPDLGLVRITLSGDWTNASPIGATVRITSIESATPGQTAQSQLNDGASKVYSFNVPPGAGVLTARLEWQGDWGQYPTNDLDLILIPPGGPPNFGGATLNVPERVTIDNPAAGQWTAFVDGFSIASKNGDRFTLRLAVDGIVLR